MILHFMSLHFKLVPVGYREYEDSLLRKRQKINVEVTFSNLHVLNGCGFMHVFFLKKISARIT